MSEQTGGSDLEIRFDRAAYALGWRPEQMRQQVPLRGGRMVRGGIVVDRVLYNPMAIPVFLNGDYWHRDKGQEMVEQAVCWQELGREPVVIWGHEAPDDEQMLAVVRERIGRP